MSYEIVRSISRRKKDNKIFITSACSNLWPRHYSRWEYMPNEFSNKELYLFRNIIGGDFKLSGSVNENWRYAENKFYEYCKDNNISVSDIWDLPCKSGGNIEVLKPYYEVFKEFLEEKQEGKYYLDSDIGIIAKVNQKSFEYTGYKGNPEKYCKNFKKAFNDYYNITQQNREKYNISIKKYELNKELNDSTRLNQKDTGLEIY